MAPLGCLDKGFYSGLTPLCFLMQKFAEKPKGKELDAMKVDTTVLGMHHFSKTVCDLYTVTPSPQSHFGLRQSLCFSQWRLENMQQASRLDAKNAN